MCIAYTYKIYIYIYKSKTHITYINNKYVTTVYNNCDIYKIYIQLTCTYIYKIYMIYIHFKGIVIVMLIVMYYGCKLDEPSFLSTLSLHPFVN